MAELWERQSGETDKSFDAFTIFRDLGPNRTLVDVFRRRSPDSRASASGRLPSYFVDWASKWNWKERAAAYDAHLDSVKRIKIEEQVALTAVEVMEERDADEPDEVWEERRRRLRKQKWNLGQAMLRQAQEMIEYPIVQQRLVGEDGTYVIMPTRWYDKQVAATIAKVGVDLVNGAVNVVSQQGQQDAEQLGVKEFMPEWLEKLLRESAEDREK